jgi:hypothetical protein
VNTGSKPSVAARPFDPSERPVSRPEERTRFIEHKGTAIVLMDFSNLGPASQPFAVFDAARRFVAAQPRARKLRTLVDVSGATYDLAILEALKSLAAHDEPWVLAGAVIGLTTLRRLAVRTVCFFTGRKLATFRTAAEAKDWLVAQAVPPTSVPDVGAEI